ncbi:MAG: COX15/CtaA family protein [Myxococcota bacterium]
MERYAKAAWAMVAYTVFVIAWGAVVRATLSGAGCGDHWPLCNGEVVPLAPSLETIIEFGHRLTSGLSLLFCVAFVVASRRVFERGHPARRAAVVALGFMVLEALIGAGLVLLKLVAENPDEARGYWAAAHVVNTFLLLGALTLHAHQAGGGAGLRLRGEPLLISEHLRQLGRPDNTLRVSPAEPL